ncbi:FUSC family protein [Arthrobacter sp. UM1]|uniref:FUSC family protein n=1 Tax=Arthrobacter sp. UM1 TaxID=2766776 RepID=UPI001CF6E3B4|nr:FUSC family protein [Arthrobacter sp. UM1]
MTARVSRDEEHAEANRGLFAVARRTPGLLGARARQGVRRMKSGFRPALQMTICAVSAFFFAHSVLGHQGPIFAATSALISLGFGVDSHLTRAIEVTLGCTLGVLIGDTVLHLFGAGVWQAALMLFFSIMMARFLDPSPILATQMGLQSLLVVLLPLQAGGPFTRSIDAVIGGSFALVLIALWPQDPRRESHSSARDALNEFAGILRECAGALAYSDSTMAWHALVRARNFHPTLEKAGKSISHAAEVARISPMYRTHRAEILNLSESIKFIDLAVRNIRVFARRLSSAITNTALTAEAQGQISHVLEMAAEGTEALALGLAETTAGARDRQLRRARRSLHDVASRLSPEGLEVSTLEGESLILILRPLIVDLLESTGLSHEDAREHLPSLAVPDDGL